MPPGDVHAGQGHACRHADQCPGNTVKDAVDAGGGAAPAGYAGGFGGEHALPDVLADQQAQGVDHEVGDDGLQADAVHLEEAFIHAAADAVEAAGGVEGEGEHQGEDAHGLDDELHLVREGDGPHAADGGVDQDDRAADGDGEPALPAEEDHKDGGVGAGGGGAQHQCVGQHHDARGLRRLAAIAKGEHLGDRVDLQFLDGAGEEEAQQDRRVQAQAMAIALLQLQRGTAGKLVDQRQVNGPAALLPDDAEDAGKPQQPEL